MKRKIVLMLLCFIAVAPCLSLSGCIRFKPYIANKAIIDSTQTSATVSVTIKNPTNKTMVCTVTAKVHWKWGGGLNGMAATEEGSVEITLAPKSDASQQFTVSHKTEYTSSDVNLKKVTIKSAKAPG